MKKLAWLVSAVFLLVIGCSKIADDNAPVTPPDEGPDTHSDVISSPPIENFYPVPSKEQLEWQDAELAMFVHFGMSTFSGNEWSDGKDDVAIFNPTKLNADQWVQEAKEAGFKYVILTAKHIDGFCLWKTETTEYSIKNSPYKNGQGDIVKEFTTACKNQGMKVGLYMAPWDRHDETFGTPDYNKLYQKQWTELLTNYGDISEVWLDGADESEALDHKKQEYDWHLYHSTIKHYQPNSLIAIMGPDIKWIGNESGLGLETEWSRQYANFTLHGTSSGMVWFPSECDVSIRPGWFYHDYEDSQVRSVQELVYIYFRSVGCNSNLLLNVPPNKDGLFSDVDVTRLHEFRAKLDEIFATDLFINKSITCSNIRYGAEEYSGTKCLDNNRKTFWAADKDTLTAQLTIDMGSSSRINIIRLEEAIEYGQRVAEFKIYAEISGVWQEITYGTTIGKTRLLKFEPVTTSKIKIAITNSLAAPTLRTVSGYYAEF